MEVSQICLRFKALRKEVNLSQKSFAEALGVWQSTIASYEIGRREPGFDIMETMSKTYNVNLNWLITGNGPMFTTGQPAAKPPVEVLAPEIKRVQMIPLNPAEFVSIRKGTGIAAGEPLECDADGHIRIPSELIGANNPDKFVFFEVKGSSMEPSIPHGSGAIVREQRDWHGVEGKVCAVVVDNDITLKVVRRCNDVKRYILQPFNPDYEPIIVDPRSSDLRLCGVLFAVVRWWEKVPVSRLS